MERDSLHITHFFSAAEAGTMYIIQDPIRTHHALLYPVIPECPSSCVTLAMQGKDRKKSNNGWGRRRKIESEGQMDLLMVQGCRRRRESTRG
jgi:hypothetical protein